MLLLARRTVCPATVNLLPVLAIWTGASHSAKTGLQRLIAVCLRSLDLHRCELGAGHYLLLTGDRGGDLHHVPLVGVSGVLLQGLGAAGRDCTGEGESVAEAHTSRV